MPEDIFIGSGGTFYTDCGAFARGAAVCGGAASSRGAASAGGMLESVNRNRKQKWNI